MRVCWRECPPCHRRAASGLSRSLADLTAPTQQLRLGEVHCEPPRFVPGEQLRRRAPTGLFVKVKVAERLSGAVADDEASSVRLSIVQRFGWSLERHYAEDLAVLDVELVKIFG